MAILSGIVTAYRAVRTIRAEKKKLEDNAAAYLSPVRAAAARLWLEKMFKALEDGPANPNFAKLPKVLRWFCGTTAIDNHIGAFGRDVLKSAKLSESARVLREDIEKWGGPAADRGRP